MPVFSTQSEFQEFEKRERLPLVAYSSLTASINKNHDLRAYTGQSDLICSRCSADLGFLVYSRQVECEAMKERKRGNPRRSLANSEPLSDAPDFELVSQNQ